MTDHSMPNRPSSSTVGNNAKKATSKATSEKAKKDPKKKEVKGKPPRQVSKGDISPRLKESDIEKFVVNEAIAAAHLPMLCV